MNVLVNAAMSADGKLSNRRREQIVISGPADFERVDALRADSDAVMVGVGPVLADDPHLTVDASASAARARGEPSQPTRVIADSRARTPPDARVLDEVSKTYLLVSEAAPTDRIEGLRSDGTEIITAGSERVDLSKALSQLDSMGVERLMVEGGGELIFSLFDARLVDELSVFVGPTVIGGREAPTLADGDGFVREFPKLSLESIERLDEGVLLRWRV